MVVELIRRTISELITPNIATVTPESMPRNKPEGYWKSNEKIMYSPTMTTTPRKTSTTCIRLFLTSGSSKAAHREQVANPTSAVEGFEILTARKNVSQCAPTTRPVRKSFVDRKSTRLNSSHG